MALGCAAARAADPPPPAPPPPVRDVSLTVTVLSAQGVPIADVPLAPRLATKLHSRTSNWGAFTDASGVATATAQLTGEHASVAFGVGGGKCELLPRAQQLGRTLSAHMTVLNDAWAFEKYYRVALGTDLTAVSATVRVKPAIAITGHVRLSPALTGGPVLATLSPLRYNSVTKTDSSDGGFKLGGVPKDEAVLLIVNWGARTTFWQIPAHSAEADAGEYTLSMEAATVPLNCTVTARPNDPVEMMRRPIDGLTFFKTDGQVVYTFRREGLQQLSYTGSTPDRLTGGSENGTLEPKLEPGEYIVGPGLFIADEKQTALVTALRAGQTFPAEAFTRVTLTAGQPFTASIEGWSVAEKYFEATRTLVENALPRVGPPASP